MRRNSDGSNTCAFAARLLETPRDFSFGSSWHFGLARGLAVAAFGSTIDPEAWPTERWRLLLDVAEEELLLQLRLRLDMATPDGEKAGFELTAAAVESTSLHGDVFLTGRRFGQKLQVW